MLDFDLIIIGSGSGNSIPSDEMATWRIALVEEGTFGGTCLNAGCIPSKMLIYPADVICDAAEAKRLGVSFPEPTVAWPEIRDRTFGRIDPISEGGKQWRTSLDNVTTFFGHAEMIADRTFQVGSETIRGERVVLAAGARPMIPHIAGLGDVNFHTSDSIMRIETLPKHLLILGTGFIANEMAHVFSAYGSRVTMIGRSPSILNGHDREIADRLHSATRGRIDFRLGHAPVAVRETRVTASDGLNEPSGNGSVVVSLENGDVLEGDALLVATGRMPNGERLGVTNGGVELDDSGYVRCDSQLRTSAPGVWAIGDIRNPAQLKHLANRDAKVVRHNLLRPDSPITVDERSVPHAVFTHPQIAALGATESELLHNGTDFVIGRRDYSGTAYGWAMEDQIGLAKVIVDPHTRLLLGAHIIGFQASLLLQPLVQGLQFGLTADQMALETIYPHPALSEVVENALLEALALC